MGLAAMVGPGESSVIHCPRCGTTLEPVAFGRATLDRCPDCEGLLVPVRGFVPLLDGLVARLAADVDPEAVIERAGDVGPIGVCPVCQGPTTHDGYQGTHLARIDRCGPCAVVWVDGAELVTVVRLHARTRRRGDERTAWHAAEQRQQADRMSRTMVANALADLLASR